MGDECCRGFVEQGQKAVACPSLQSWIIYYEKNNLMLTIHQFCCEVVCFMLLFVCVGKHFRISCISSIPC